MKPQATALSIAGSDPSGGAGIQADLKVFQAHKVYGMAVPTLLTVQNTKGVHEVQTLEPSFVIKQIQSLIEDIPPQAIKVGALFDELVEPLLSLLQEVSCPVVFDPIVESSNGVSFISERGLRAVKEKVCSAATLVTPNLGEASKLTGLKVHDLESMRESAVKLKEMGAKNVLITGGHLEDSPTDFLLTARGGTLLSGTRVHTPNTHGTGCMLTSAIAANLARGEELESAISLAKEFLEEALKNIPGITAP